MKLRFSIRDLILFTAIVALALGWWVDHRWLTRELQAFGGSLFDSGGWNECTTLAEAVRLAQGKLSSDGKRDYAALLTEARVRQAIKSAIVCMDRHATEDAYPPAIYKDWRIAKRTYLDIVNTSNWPPGATINGFYGFSDNVNYDEGLGLRIRIPIQGNLQIHELPILDISLGHF